MAYIPTVREFHEDCAEYFEDESSQEFEQADALPKWDEWGEYRSDDDSDDDSDAESIEVIMTVDKPMGHGYSFVTSNISFIDEEINRVNAGKLILYQTYKLPRSLYLVKVWVDGWTNKAMEKELLAGRKVRINISSSYFWMVQYLAERLP